MKVKHNLKNNLLDCIDLGKSREIANDFIKMKTIMFVCLLKIFLLSLV